LLKNVKISLSKFLTNQKFLGRPRASCIPRF